MEQFIKYKMFLLMKHLGWSFEKATDLRNKLDAWAIWRAVFTAVPAFAVAIGLTCLIAASALPGILCVWLSIALLIGSPALAIVYVVNRHEAIRREHKNIPPHLQADYSVMTQAQNQFAKLLKDSKIQFITSRYLMLIRAQMSDYDYHFEQFDNALLDDNFEKATYHFFTIYTNAQHADGKISAKNFFHKQREMLIAEKELIEELLSYSNQNREKEVQQALEMEAGGDKFAF